MEQQMGAPCLSKNNTKIIQANLQFAFASHDFLMLITNIFCTHEATFTRVMLENLAYTEPTYNF